MLSHAADLTAPATGLLADGDGHADHRACLVTESRRSWTTCGRRAARLPGADADENEEDLTGALPLQSGNFNLQILKSRHGGKGHLSTLRMSLREAAKQMGVAFSVVTRLENGTGVHLDSAKAVLHWLDGKKAS